MRSKLTPFSIALIAVGLLLNGLYVASLDPDSKLSTWHYDSNVNRQTGCDFYALYLACANFSRGENIYQGDPEHLIAPCAHAYRYLPVGVIVGAPFAAASPKIAYVLWVILLELLVLVNVALLYWISPSDKIFGLGALGFLGASPLFLELYMGQYSLLQATLLFAAMAALIKGRDKTFAVAFAASLLWKLNTWIAIPALVRAKRIAAPLGALAVILMTSLPYFLMKPESWSGFFEINFGLDPENGFTRGNHGLIRLVSLFTGQESLAILLWLIPLLVIAVTLAVTIAARRAHAIDLLCLWNSAYFLAYKHVWEHHYVMLFPVLAILAVRHRSPFPIIPGFLAALPTVYPLLLSQPWPPGWELIYHAQLPLAAFLTYGFCAAKSTA